MRWGAYCTQLLVNFFPRGYIASGRAEARTQQGHVATCHAAPPQGQGHTVGSRGGAGQKRGAQGTMNGGTGEPLVSSLQNWGRDRLCLAQRGSKPLNKAGSYLFPPALHFLPTSPGTPAGPPTRRGCPHWGPKPWSFIRVGTHFPPHRGLLALDPLSPTPSFKFLPHSWRCW